MILLHLLYIRTYIKIKQDQHMLYIGRYCGCNNKCVEDAHKKATYVNLGQVVSTNNLNTKPLNEE